MLKPIINPPESYAFEIDRDLKTSVDGLTATVVTSVPHEYPPLDAFSVENLMSNGMSLNPVFNFFTPSSDEVEETLDKINDSILSNELTEF